MRDLRLHDDIVPSDGRVWVAHGDRHIGELTLSARVGVDLNERDERAFADRCLSSGTILLGLVAGMEDDGFGSDLLTVSSIDRDGGGPCATISGIELTEEIGRAARRVSVLR